MNKNYIPISMIYKVSLSMISFIANIDYLDKAKLYREYSQNITINPFRKIKYNHTTILKVNRKNKLSSISMYPKICLPSLAEGSQYYGFEICHTNYDDFSLNIKRNIHLNMF